MWRLANIHGADNLGSYTAATADASQNKIVDNAQLDFGDQVFDGMPNIPYYA